MIGKLRALVGGLQTRMAPPRPPAKPAGMHTADAFVAQDRGASVRASGPKALMGLPPESIAAEIGLDAARKTEFFNAVGGARKSSTTSDGLGDGGTPEGIKLA